MRNPHGNLLCPKHGHNFIEEHGGQNRSGPWGVTCGYWRCTDDRCCLIDGEPENFPMENHVSVRELDQEEVVK